MRWNGKKPENSRSAVTDSAFCRLRVSPPDTSVRNWCFSPLLVQDSNFRTGLMYSFSVTATRRGGRRFDPCNILAAIRSGAAASVCVTRQVGSEVTSSGSCGGASQSKHWWVVALPPVASVIMNSDKRSTATINHRPHWRHWRPGRGACSGCCAVSLLMNRQSGWAGYRGRPSPSLIHRYSVVIT